MVSRSNYENLKVLLEGLHDPDSSLNMLRQPRNVVEDMMEIIWKKVTEDWQVFLIAHH